MNYPLIAKLLRRNGFHFKIAIFLIFIAEGAARAESCEESVSMLKTGMAGVVSFQVGSAHAKTICERLLKNPNPDPSLVKQCSEVGNVAVNPRLQDAHVQRALSRFEKTFGIPKDDFIQSLDRGTLGSLMANRGISQELLDRALSTTAHGDPQPSGTTAVEAPPTSIQGRVPSTSPRVSSGQNRLREQLRAKLADSQRPRSVGSVTAENRSLEGLTPIDREFFLESADDKDTESLTIFQVVHLRYHALTHRMKPESASGSP